MFASTIFSTVYFCRESFIHKKEGEIVEDKYVMLKLKAADVAIEMVKKVDWKLSIGGEMDYSHMTHFFERVYKVVFNILEKPVK